jgi:hypothetical protein
MHLSIKYFDPVDMDRARVVNSVFRGLVSTADMDLGLF